MKYLPDQIKHAHDLFVRSFLSDIIAAREFFAVYLPKDILETIDLKTLEHQPTAHITELQKEYITDLLFKVHQIDSTCLMYLIIEHQSRNDKLMSLRISEYTNRVVRYHMQNAVDDGIPMVYSLVIYHGKEKYSAKKYFHDIVNANEKVAKYHGCYEVVDFREMPDDALPTVLSVKVMGFILKHIYDKDLLPQILKIKDIIQQLNYSGRRHLVRQVLQYALFRGEIKDKKAFYLFVRKCISNNLGDIVMSLGEQLWREGLEKGLQKGLQEGRSEGRSEGLSEGLNEGRHAGRHEGWQECSRTVARNMLVAGFAPNDVASLTGLSLETVLALNVNEAQH